METIRTDFAVIGIGAVGASTLYQLAKRGVKVIGIDRYSPPHRFGSSHGQGRVTRTAVGEGNAYVPLVRRSQEILSELERNAEVELMARTGTLIVGSTSDQFVRRTIEIAVENDVAHHIFTSSELQALYPQLIGLKRDDTGYFEPDAGFLLPEAVVREQIRTAKTLGADLLTEIIVDKISQENGVVKIRTGEHEVWANHAVIAAGSWTGGILGAPFDRVLRVKGQRTFSFRPETDGRYGRSQLPALMWFRSDASAECINVFPQSHAEGVGFFVENVEDNCETEKIAKRFYDLQVRPYFSGISRNLVETVFCTYTETPDHGFIIDQHPSLNKLTVVSACSGHGFKHSLAVGEIAAQLAMGEPTIELAMFKLGRLIAC